MSLVLLDHWDPLEREELPVTVVSLVKMVWLVQREPPVSVDPQEPAVPKVPAVTPAALESPVCPVPEV